MYRLQIFGASDRYFSRLQKFQRVVVSRCLGNYRLPEEDVGTFHRRSFHQAKSVIGQQVCDWAELWSKGTVLWDAHLERDWDRQRIFLDAHPQSSVRLAFQQPVWNLAESRVVVQTSFSWAAALSRFKNEKFFDTVRTFFLSRHRRSSRTNTRSRKGYVHIRWHDVVRTCKDRGLLVAAQ